MLVDLHLHTFVSDGDLDPAALLARAASAGITHLAIADHDTLGAYAWEGGRVFAEARRLRLELIVGVELDHPGLAEHLERVRAARFERARRDIAIVNDRLGAGSISVEEIFVPGRITLMKPHFIHPLLEKGLFESYPAANAWYKQNVRSGVSVPKLPLGDGTRLIHAAGGFAILAHSGFYEKEGMPIVPRLSDLVARGLDGLEVDYPYHSWGGARRAGATVIRWRTSTGSTGRARPRRAEAPSARLGGPRGIW
jgi:predicted metal-dependent phosphoesterase TrpH